MQGIVGSKPGWKLVSTMYVTYVMTGVNDLNKDSVRLSACKGYAVDATILFTFINFPS